MNWPSSGFLWFSNAGVAIHRANDDLLRVDRWPWFPAFRDELMPGYI